MVVNFLTLGRLGKTYVSPRGRRFFFKLRNNGQDSQCALFSLGTWQVSGFSVSLGREGIDRKDENTYRISI